jgi:hypothetical protein
MGSIIPNIDKSKYIKIHDVPNSNCEKISRTTNDQTDEAPTFQSTWTVLCTGVSGEFTTVEKTHIIYMK